ncbi:class I SAM-dependent RNA methyltransferase [Haliangium ochraceum]|uniref:Deoxyribonuclease/rho motif-related TRAM n=1 Tax=Haliangium ochraceum (strain DSM 14365 / JCM 11303 / SMP-2) TaxID=502025 RepID=D0LY41_HALO1|nr:TRAM domain-containing protein [Haliangium ochraceum]ACY16191.1 deoxyribonuclease/rho motif-related TRAM [Haliangium ochraceum DSM 14365]
MSTSSSSNPPGGSGRPRGKRGGKRDSRRERAGGGRGGVGQRLEVTVDALAAGGDGVGRDAQGRVTFVPYAAPGDTLLVEIDEVRKDYARATPIEIVRASPARVEAPCAHFNAGRCGGCQWLHLGSSAQASAKDELCERALRRQVEAGMELRPVRSEVPPYHWRRRARLHWYRPRKSEAATIGFFGPRSHRVSPIDGCVQLAPPLLAALSVIRERLAPTLGRTGSMELLAGHGGDVHLSIRGRCDLDAAADLVGQGPVVGVRVEDQAGQPGARRRPPARFGKPHIELEAGFFGRADVFAQSSADGNRALLDEVENALRDVAQSQSQSQSQSAEESAGGGGLAILELHAGAGNLTRALATHAARLVAVERRKPPWTLPVGLEAASADAAAVAARAFVAGDVADVCDKLSDADARFDVIVLDPPRTGAREVLEPLSALAPGYIIYVSCNPATLARDLDVLSEHGYAARWAQPLDLMPQTSHIEVVTLLERRPAS